MSLLGLSISGKPDVNKGYCQVVRRCKWQCLTLLLCAYVAKLNKKKRREDCKDLNIAKDGVPSRDKCVL